MTATSTQPPPASTTNGQSVSHISNDSLTQQQQSHKRAQYKEGPKFGLKSMVSMDDMPELFASFDSKYMHLLSIFVFKYLGLYHLDQSSLE